MALIDDYTFGLTLPNGQNVRCTPLNDRLEFTWVREEDNGIFVHELDTTIKFIDEPGGQQAFSKIYEYDRFERDACAEFRFTIQPKCAAPEVLWEGVFTVADCKFHVEQCFIEVKVRVKGKWSCLTDAWKDDINLVEQFPGWTNTGQVTQVKFYTVDQDDVLEIEATPEDNPDDPNGPPIFPEFDEPQERAEYVMNNLNLFSVLNGVDTSTIAIHRIQWTLFKYSDLYQEIEGDLNNPYRYFIKPTFWTEVIQSPTEPTLDNGNPWVEVSPGEWHRRPVQYCSTSYEDVNLILDNPAIDYIYVLNDVCQISKYSEHHNQIVRRLNRFLSIQFNRRCVQTNSISFLVSHFFGINTDRGSLSPPVNSAYAYAAEYAQRLGYISAHDTIFIDPISGDKPNGIEFDTNIEFSLRDVLDDLILIFNLKLFYREDENIWYLEHVSFLEGVNALNLIAPQNEAMLKGQWVYEYTTQDVPTKETFKWVRDTDQLEEEFPGTAIRNFDGYPIKYEGNCIDRNSDEQIYQTQIFMTNYEDLLLAYEDAKIQAVENDNANPAFTYNSYYRTKIFFLVDMSRRDAVVGCGPRSTGQVNAQLGWPCLHENLYRYDRYLRSGIMNEQMTTFFSTKKKRVQRDVAIFMCCADYWSSFIPWNFIRTQLDWGKLEQARYETISGQLTITTQHD